MGQTPPIDREILKFIYDFVDILSMRHLLFLLLMPFDTAWTLSQTMSDYMACQSKSAGLMSTAPGNSALIHGCHPKESTLYDMATRSEIYNFEFNRETRSCTYQISQNDPNSSNQSLVIKIDSDEGDYNKISYYHKHNDSLTSRHRPFAGLILNYDDRNNFISDIVCRTTTISELESNNCQSVTTPNYNKFLSFFLNSGEDLFDIPGRSIEEYSGAMAQCCADTNCADEIHYMVQSRGMRGLRKRIRVKNGEAGKAAPKERIFQTTPGTQ